MPKKPSDTLQKDSLKWKTHQFQVAHCLQNPANEDHVPLPVLFQVGTPVGTSPVRDRALQVGPRVDQPKG